jgi:hypothetical protein
LAFGGGLCSGLRALIRAAARCADEAAVRDGSTAANSFCESDGAAIIGDCGDGVLAFNVTPSTT